MSNCNCTALMKEVSDMCSRCKLEYIEFATGLNRRDVVWLAKVATADERAKSLKLALQERKSLKSPKRHLRLVRA
jgi:hypothetical protein